MSRASQEIISQQLRQNKKYHHKKGPPKMIKDLKYGNNAHLRQSLLDIAQIQNMNNLFLGRKGNYKINDQTIQIQQHENQQNLDIKEFMFLSPQENLQLIKKQRINNMMKDKMNSMFQQKQVRKYKMRKPIIHKMLEDFKQSFRVDDVSKIKQALKTSEKHLQHIKINNRKKLASQYKRSQSSICRSKFISISTGKPIVHKNYFPTFENFIEGKYQRHSVIHPGIDFEKIDNYFNTLITQPQIRQKRISITREVDVHRQNQLRSRADTSTALNSYTMENFTRSKLRVKSAINPNKTFLRSQQSSKKIISEMSCYYLGKKQKNSQCESILNYLKKDRPLTSNIRRKNYTLIGSPLQQVSKYRKKSQNQRILILKQNYDFYINLLKLFQHCKKDQIITTLTILSRVKQFFQSEYVLHKQDVNEICKFKGTQDFGVQILKDNLIEYANKDVHIFSKDNQQDQYQII